jgi:phospholipid:diacylglycerol acyltransferase
MHATHTHGQFLSFRQGADLSASNASSSSSSAGALGGGAGAMQNLSAFDAGTWILTRTPGAFQRMMETNYSRGIERDAARLAANGADPTKWTNPLEVQCVSRRSGSFERGR